MPALSSALVPTGDVGLQRPPVMLVWITVLLIAPTVPATSYAIGHAAGRARVALRFWFKLLTLWAQLLRVRVSTARWRLLATWARRRRRLRTQLTSPHRSIPR
jgi:hypothetical protein